MASKLKKVEKWKKWVEMECYWQNGGQAYIKVWFGIKQR